MKRSLLFCRRDFKKFLVATLMMFCATLLAHWTLGGKALSQNEKEKPPVAIAARPGDVESIDAIIASVYDVISGPAGGRDWDRLRSLFHSEARLIPCFPSPKDQNKRAIATRVLTVEQYIEMATPKLTESGFFEREVARRVERFGAIAHLFSTYESRHAADDPQPFTRGINSIQLFFDGTRWWIVTIFWDSERPGQAIPDEFQPKK
jgi:hypothetical protein